MRYNFSMKRMNISLMARVVILLVSFQLSCFSVSAQSTDSVKVFTEEHPLIYEDAWDLWPYVFLNENGVTNLLTEFIFFEGFHKISA